MTYRAIYTTADAPPSWVMLDFVAPDLRAAEREANFYVGKDHLYEWGHLTLVRVIRLRPSDVGKTLDQFVPIPGPTLPSWARAKGRRR